MQLLVMALAIATVTVTVTKSPLFAWLRKLAGRISLTKELLSCLYCTSHWVSFAAVALFWHGDLSERIMVAFALVAMSAPAMLLINASHNKMQWGDSDEVEQ